MPPTTNDHPPATGPAYAGDLSARDAYTVLLEDDRAVLVDVRSDEEVRSVGQPDLDELSNRLVIIPWIDTSGNPNTAFAKTLADAVHDRATPLLVLCRSGTRSRAAATAAATAGFRLAINVADGFEGPAGPNGQRGTVSGWQADGLPWKQVSHGH